MSSSVNICIFLGNLTRDPELKWTPSGTAVCEMGLAVNKSYTAQNGEKREEVSFFDFVAWGKTAEIAAKYLKKGRAVHFTCEAKLDTWDDRQTGQKRSKVRFTVEKLTLLPSGKGREDQDDDDGSAEDEPAPPPKKSSFQSRRPAPPPRNPIDADLDAPPEDDDVPF